MDGGAWSAAVHEVAKSQTRLSDFTFTFHFHALEKEMATHSSVLAWRIPGTGEPGGLPSMELQSQTRLKRLSSSSSSRMKQSVSSALTKCRHRRYPQEILAVLHTCSSAMHFYGGAALILTGDFPLYDICSRNFLLGYNLTFQRCILLKVSVPSHCYI